MIDTVRVKCKLCKEEFDMVNSSILTGRCRKCLIGNVELVEQLIKGVDKENDEIYES